ncbi:MAG: inositol monophosphatase [Candidatus Marinimicrobia bacterium]|jgi:myo-inositol-1(or 4)-monophosphatase|nr:inositol monophosphatase [Candidatus Neomarinimicrobiota bacterium]MBT3631970.1 inositol monophosphatase [Candidatus Neomarinimicrobiota bacterium]MBT3824556.1 inositol monophosphatase [Candidatus Neomarinimicrobiota bacterium]MBT4130269.1 inositol monophosphatase [Candidatus Neomarinimicrobiota bacterium]MBT4297020.1 inositol monophosphatase [Candidatus Neomarinimicrobiota bacterium]
MDNNLDQLIKDAGTIAKSAGEIILELNSHERQISYKSARDMVTEVDQASENYIVSEINRLYPEHEILAEEGGASTPNQSPYKWIIDPLDGTTNFVHGFPVFAVSIGIQFENELFAAAVFDPNRHELFTAGRDRGAFLNGEPISVSKTHELGKSLMATGFSYFNDDYFKLNMELWASIYGKTQGLRRAGAAAIDLAWLACGRLDGLWEFSLKPWDIAAGALLVKEAGGLVSGPLGEDLDLSTGHIIAANPSIHPHIIKEISLFKHRL